MFVIARVRAPCSRASFIAASVSAVSSDHERVLREHGIPVDPLGGDVGLDRDARPLLDDVTAHDRRVVGRPACDDDDATEVTNLELGQADAVEHELAASRAVADRLADRFGLIVDLLQHERLVAALLGPFVVPVDRLDLLVLDFAAGVEESRSRRCDRDHFTFVDQLDATRLPQECRDRRGEEHLAVADADDERALPARADQELVVIVVDDDECEVSFDVGVRGADGLDQIAVVVALDQVHDDLGVCLGAERVAVRDQ